MKKILPIISACFLVIAAIIIALLVRDRRRSRREITNKENARKELEKANAEILEQYHHREQQDKMITALASDYRCVYHIDLDNDDAVCYRADPTDKETWQKTYDLLKWMRDEGIYGISEVYTTEEINEKEHLSGEFSFVIESDGYTSFAEDWKRPMVKQLDLTDYRYGKATHGHNPDKGPQPIFFGFGKDIKEGVLIERRPTVDEAPTYAKILGVEMPGVDGTPITEMLK